MSTAFNAESKTASDTDYSDNEGGDTDYLYKKNKPMLANGAHPLMLSFIKDSLVHPLKVFGNDAHELLSKPKKYIQVLRSPLNKFDDSDTYIVDPDQFTDGDEIRCPSEWIAAWTRYLFYIKLDLNPLPSAKCAMEQHFTHMKTLLTLGFADTPEEFESMMRFDAKVRENFGRDFSYYGEEEYAQQFRDIRLKCIKEFRASSKEPVCCKHPPPYNSPSAVEALSTTVSKKRKLGVTEALS